MASFRDLLQSTKARIREVDTAGAAEAIKAPGAVVLDVREADEYDQGALPGAVHIPRGFLESQVEGKIGDRDAPVVVYCAGGTRSAFAAETLGQLGYTNVVSMAGGFNRWKDEGRAWKTPATLTPEQRNRYQRHLLLPEVDVAGQTKLLESKVLLIGAGGLGSPAALYLAAAGVGKIGIVDYDTVDLSNLHRQIIHGHANIGRPKVDSVRERLADVNPDVEVVTFNEPISSANAMDILKDFDVVVNGSDNFPTRYLVNDASYLLGKPLVDGTLFRFEGRANVFLPGKGCYRCLFPSPPPPGAVPSCAEAGVLGAMCGVIGTIQAVETIKLLLGLGDPLVNRLMLFDSLSMEFREVKIPRDPDCPLCGDNPTIHELIDYEAFCGAPVTTLG
jgi:adenylyltransferase/sulfurtransferase